MRFFVDHVWQSTVVATVALLTLAAAGPWLSARERRAIAWIALAKFLLPSALFAGALRWLDPGAQPLLAPAPLPRGISAGILAALGTERSGGGGWVWVAIWATGIVTVLASSCFGGWWSARSLARLIVAGSRGRSARGDRALHHLLKDAAERTGLKSVPAWQTVPSDQSPAVAGIFRPVLLIPDGLPEVLDEEELRAVLLHECAHIAGRDNAWAAARTVFVALFWFHPLVWILSRRIELETELLRDEAVLDSGVEPHRFVVALAKTVRHALGLLPTRTAAAGATPLGIRLANLLTLRRRPPLSLRWLGPPAVGAALGAVVLSGYAGSITAAPVYAADSGPPPGQTRLFTAPEVHGSTRIALVDPPSSPSEAPTALEQRPPAYPPGLRQQGISGTALIEFTVDDKGRVRDPIIRQYDRPEFARAAAEAVSGWRYRPVRHDGQPTAAQVQVRVVFSAASDLAGFTPALRPVTVSILNDL